MSKITIFILCSRYVLLRHSLNDGEGKVGTSFSAAYVAGVAALLLEQDPDMTMHEVLSGLKSIFDPILRAGKAEEKESNVDVKIQEELASKKKAIAQSQEEFAAYAQQMAGVYFEAVEK